MDSRSIAFAGTDASGLESAGVTRLPMRVDSAAWAAAVYDDLFVLINQPGTSETALLRVTPPAGERVSPVCEQLGALPVVAAGVAACQQQLLITGADPAGNAVVLAVTTGGQISWRHSLPARTPVRWPLPGCAWAPVVAWQESQLVLDVAAVSSAGFSDRRSIQVGRLLRHISIAGDAVRAAWFDPDGVGMIHILNEDVRNVRMAAQQVSDVAVGHTDTGPCLAWATANEAYFTRLDPHGAPASAHVQLNLGRAHGGRLAVISGQEPLVWAMRVDFVENEGQLWTSSLVLPGHAALTIDGPVHAVNWWGDRVAVVSGGEIYFLKRRAQETATAADTRGRP